MAPLTCYFIPHLNSFSIATTSNASMFSKMKVSTTKSELKLSCRKPCAKNSRKTYLNIGATKCKNANVENRSSFSTQFELQCPNQLHFFFSFQFQFVENQCHNLAQISLTEFSRQVKIKPFRLKSIAVQCKDYSGTSRPFFQDYLLHLAFLNITAFLSKGCGKEFQFNMLLFSFIGWFLSSF